MRLPDDRNVATPIGHIPFAGSVQEHVVRESRTLRAILPGLETDLRCG